MRPRTQRSASSERKCRLVRVRVRVRVRFRVGLGFVRAEVPPGWGRAASSAWAGTRAHAPERTPWSSPPLAPKAAGSLLLGPEASPEQAGGPLKWWAAAWAATSKGTILLAMLRRHSKPNATGEPKASRSAERPRSPAAKSRQKWAGTASSEPCW
eukprot:scaffold26389_cov37-Phaeocystis_antarctica.AAC.1